MSSRVHQPGDRHDARARADAVADADLVGVAGQRHQVGRGEHAAGGDLAAEAATASCGGWRRIEALVAAGILDRLEDDAAHARPLQRMVDDRARIPRR